MYKTGHYGTGFLFAAPAAFILMYFQQYVPAVLSVIVILSLTRIPDMDLYLKGIKHRGITHTFVFAAMMGIITGLGIAGALYVIPDHVLNMVPQVFEITTTTLTLVYAFGYGFVLGFIAILAHLFADIITPTGLQPLVPFDDTRYRFEIARASDPYANIALFLLGQGATIGAFLFALHLTQ